MGSDLSMDMRWNIEQERKSGREDSLAHLRSVLLKETRRQITLAKTYHGSTVDELQGLIHAKIADSLSTICEEL